MQMSTSSDWCRNAVNGDLRAPRRLDEVDRPLRNTERTWEVSDGYRNGIIIVSKSTDRESRFDVGGDAVHADQHVQRRVPERRERRPASAGRVGGFR